MAVKSRRMAYTDSMPRRSDSASPAEVSYRSRVLALVRLIPAGRVATYGQIARLAGKPRAPRQVGNILAGLKADEGDVPWQRVLNAQGGVSPRADFGGEIQQQLLEAEGIRFVQGRCDLSRCQWAGPSGSSDSSNRPA